MKVSVTGASGFVGFSLIQHLLTTPNVSVQGVTHGVNRRLSSLFKTVQIDNFSAGDFSFLSGFDVVIHTAGLVHNTNIADTFGALTEYRMVNVEGTLNLAKQAADAGLKRFVYISSIKVHGEQTQMESPLLETNAADPFAPYAISKFEAEQGLVSLSHETDMEIVIIRSPLVYGPGVKANFLRMMDWVYKGIPLPLGGINNKRSLVALDNLIDFIVTCIHHPAAANQTFFVSDDHDLSTPDLLHSLFKYLGRSDKVFSVPPRLLAFAGKLLNKEAELQRLCGSLQVDISKAKNMLGWRPPVSVDSALQQTADWYLEHKNKGTWS